MSPSLAVRALGSGPSVLLVHGDVAPGPTWKDQEPLAERWRLVIATRRGFRMSPSADAHDPEADARDLEHLLARERAHAVGFASGASGLILLAARDPGLMRSLTLIEPSPPRDGVDVSAVAGQGLKAIVLSGDHDPARDAECDALAERLGAAHERLPGAGQAVQRTPGFNARLERFLFSAEMSANRA